ncbi:glycosyltransferase family 2 protein [Lonepinella koalarum]|uniref:glycosyltransferase n=1 Tax=Lonepinella koalarum TaxID=53417 RepID=UPI0011E3DBAD|nr:glycosyltransferase family 2 protein [Lonepinella koalarum]TYG33820.1 glycosyltransferase family 2 protein [Lonepinella koalarum]
MNFSIIIPTYKAEKYLISLLDKLYHQSISNNIFELIIIDSSSTDKTVEIAKRYTDKVIVILSSEFDHGGTRAKAAEMATGDVLIYFTQDALPYDEFCIENIVKVFKDKNVAAAYGCQISYPNTNLFGKHLREFNYPSVSSIKTKDDIEIYGIKTCQLSNSFAAYRKNVLIGLGNFKNNLILGEDVYIGAKMILAGYSLAYVSDAKVYHSHSYTILQDFKRYFDIGVFHASEPWILKEFGKATGEGGRYVKSELNYLLKNNAYHLLPNWFFRNAMKFLGYKLGTKSKKLPLTIIKKISMHSRWWDK